MKKIPLTQGKFALVDDGDFEWLSQWSWYASKSGRTYRAVRGDYSSGKRKAVYMHRLLCKSTDMVDHIDRDGLNNQRHNLRPCNNTQNQHNSDKQLDNTSGYKGVYWCKQKNRWRAIIRIDGKLTHQGYFKDKIEAARAYDKAALEYFGEFSRINLTSNDL